MPRSYVFGKDYMEFNMLKYLGDVIQVLFSELAFCDRDVKADVLCLLWILIFFFILPPSGEMVF